MTTSKRGICVFVGLLVNIPGHAAEIWLSGHDPYMRQIADPGAQSDFMDLFRPGAPWPDVQRKVQVLKISTQFVLRGDSDQLRQTFAGLRQRGISLAVEALMLSGDGKCGRSIEGYAAPTAMMRLGDRIKELGGDLAYVAMDEALWFGHSFTRKETACRTSIPDLAQEVANHAADLRRAFPHVRVGDIEPVGGANQPSDWPSQVQQWMRAYQAAMGEPLAFLHLDIQWRSPSWQSQLRDVTVEAREAGVRIGIVANGDPRAADGSAWTSAADTHLHAAIAVLGSTPDQIIFQSWDIHPRYFLPETNPGTMTGLVRQYFGR